MATGIDDRLIVLRGGSFRYRCAGSPSLPPVVLLHALTADSTSWDMVALALCARFRVLALDQRGHGLSARASDYSFEAMRDDVVEFAEAVGANRFSLIGHSMGGTVAYLIGASIPERVDTLIIEDTAPPWSGAVVPATPEKPTSDIPYDWSVVKEYFAQLRTPDPAWWTKLSVITARTLIIGGGASSLVPQDVLAEVAKRIMGAKMLTIEGAGHHVHATKLAEFLVAVQSFLQQPTELSIRSV